VSADLGDEQFPSDELRTLGRDGVNALEQFLKVRFDGIVDATVRWRRVATEIPAFVARFLGLFRSQQVPSTADAYHPLEHNHVERMRANQNLKLVNLHWLILAGPYLWRARLVAFGRFPFRLFPNGEGRSTHCRRCCT